MADENGNGTSKSRRPSKLTYFYLNGKLHKKLLINRAADTIITWCYPDGKRITYTYSDVIKNRSRAFTTAEVAKLLNRGLSTLEAAMYGDNFPLPQYTYGIDENRNRYKYMWSENDIMTAHDYFLTQHRGRPRNDGIIVPQKMPSKRELRAMIRQDIVTYIKTDDGQLIPTWLAEDF